MIIPSISKALYVHPEGVGNDIAYFVYSTHDEHIPVAGPFMRHREAWRWIDRHEGSPISRSEKTAEWYWDRMVHGE
jgi:hypothetical protein